MYVRSFQVPFHKRYKYKITTTDLVQIENLNKQTILQFNFNDNTFNTFKYDNLTNKYEMSGNHSKNKIYDDVKYKDNNGIGNNYCYKIGFAVIYDNFSDLYDYVCSENFIDAYAIFFESEESIETIKFVENFVESEASIKTIKFVENFVESGYIEKTFLPTDEHIDWKKIINLLKSHGVVGTRYGTGYTSYDEYLSIVLNYNLTVEETNCSIEHILTGFRDVPNLKSHLINLYLEYVDKPITQSKPIKLIGEMVNANYGFVNPGIIKTPLYSSNDCNLIFNDDN